MPNQPVFTVLLLTYNRPALLKDALDAFFRQTYENLEIILINNGGTPEIVECVHEAARRDRRVKLIHFKENQYHPDDPQRPVHVCLNAGLKAATGDYVWSHHDDDFLADDYAEKMVRLFQENPDCTTAAGRAVSIDLGGRVLDKDVRVSDYRARYMPGHLLTLDILRRGRTLFGAPGPIFTVRRDVLIQGGGYHRAIELGALYGIVPFGVTGFDETAILYWRRHDGQLNRQMSAAGRGAFRDCLNLFKDWSIENRWKEAFDGRTAREVVRRAKDLISINVANRFLINLFQGRFKASWRMLRGIARYPRFWMELPGLTPKYIRRILYAPVIRISAPLIRCVFWIWPGLASRSPRFARLRERVGLRTAGH